MTPEQRKALEQATIWQCRKDGMSAREARGLARRAVRAYTREASSSPKAARSATSLPQAKHLHQDHSRTRG